MSYVKHNSGPKVALRREMSMLRHFKKYIEISLPGRQKEQHLQRPRGNQAQS